MAGLSPTQRTLRALRGRGLLCAITEKFNPHVGLHGIRQDLFGIIDVLALDPQKGFIGVQSTGSAFSAHEKKLLVEKHSECIEWLSTPGGNLELWGWRKIKKKHGGKAMIWAPRVRVFTLDDFC